MFGDYYPRAFDSRGADRTLRDQRGAIRDAGSQAAHEAAYKGCVLALLPEEPAGRISTRNAGALCFRATLTRHPDEEKSTGLNLINPPLGARFYYLTQTNDATSDVQEISCEIRALHIEHLTNALDAVMRCVTAYAALTEAVLETRAVRLAEPSVTPAVLVEGLTRQLSGVGLHTSFGPSWTPVPGAEASVGTRGLKEDFRTFLHIHSEWRPPCTVVSPLARLD